MMAGDGWPLADPQRALAEAVVNRLEEHERIDGDSPRRSSFVRRARGRERGADPHDSPVVHEPTHGARA
jgi:hypothetical protein